MDIEVANQNEFLAPLLQDFRRGPMVVDPRRIRRQFVTARAETLRQRALVLQESGSAALSLESSREYSASVADHDGDMSPPTSPIQVSASPSHTLQTSPESCDAARIETEPTTNAVSGFVAIQAQLSTPSSDYDTLPSCEIPVIEGATSTPAPTILPPTDATLTDAVPEAPVPRPATQVIDLTQDDEPSQPPRLGARTLAKASSLGERQGASSPRVVVPAKRACLGMRKDYAFYPELPLVQGDIRHFFRPSILA
jgi:hypothetical protein